MEPRRTPARRAGLVALAALLVFGASACSSGTNTLVGAPPAATVDGTVITQDEVNALAAANLAFYEQAGDLGQDQSGELSAIAEQVKPSSDGTMDMDLALEALDSLIRREVLRTELARKDALPGKAELAAARASLEQQVGGKDALDKFDQDFIEFTTESKALDTALRDQLAAEADKGNVTLTEAQQEDQMRALFAQAAPTLPVCLNGVAAATEAEAAQARSRADAGEDFGTIARDFAPEGTPVPEDGFLACMDQAQATQTIGTDITGAKVGDVYGPIELSDQSGTPAFYVFEIGGLDGPTYEQLLPQLLQAVPLTPEPTDPAAIAAEEVAAAIQELFSDADVTVNAQFGTWDADANRITPPVDPATTTTTAPVAVAGGPVAGEPVAVPVAGGS